MKGGKGRNGNNVSKKANRKEQGRRSSEEVQKKMKVIMKVN